MNKISVILLLILVFPFTAKSEKRSERIIGGEQTVSYPWMVSITAYDRHHCGGVLIASDWVITAAHCMESIPCYNIDEKELKIAVGSHDLDKQKIIIMADSIIHPDYNCLYDDSDIALLKLKESIDLPLLKIIGSDTENTEAVTLGWGIIGYDPPLFPDWPPISILPNTLQELTVNIISNSECKEFYPDELTDNMICTVADDGKGACSGDSGGPLIIKQNGEWVLAGITNWGADEGCASGKPDVFARVSKFKDFIYKHIGYPNDMPHDYNSDQKVGLEDAVYVIRSITVENSTEHDLSAAIEILQIMSGFKGES